jgi:hypothetical protein
MSPNPRQKTVLFFFAFCITLNILFPIGVETLIQHVEPEGSVNIFEGSGLPTIVPSGRVWIGHINGVATTLMAYELGGLVAVATGLYIWYDGKGNSEQG